ncbi:integumentary mucin -like protein [Labeo rohita]|uniref:Integumentary mucin-like protein n=1 Tax=Labeo rohita TaxID=84645 RepID=A0A498NHY8_LABRO|nr:integumentary mucin -like protein [Labeo rohita]
MWPGVTNVTNSTTTTQAPVYGSCANPGLCCSGLDNSCHRKNCYCDVACLRLNDCCPDFKPTCLTVNNTTNSTKPNALPLTGTCSNPTLCCSGGSFNCFRGCFCDEECKQYKDCCPDFNSTCNFNTTTAAPPVTTNATSPFNSTATPPKDVLTILTNLEVEVLADESSTEAERQAALREVQIYHCNEHKITKTCFGILQVLTVLTVLVVKVKILLPEEKHQAALLKVGSWVESFLRVNNTDIYSFNITEIKRVSP